MTIRIEWIDPAVEDVGAAGWDAEVEAGGLVGTWRRAVLAAYARAGLREIHLAQARDGAETVGLFCLVAGLSSVPGRRYVRPGQWHGVRPLLCRLPFSFSPGHHVVPGRPPAYEVAVVRALTGAVRARFGRAVPALGFLGVGDHDAQRFAWCPLSVTMSPVAVVDVPAGGAGEFLAGQTRRRRRRLADAVARAADLPGSVFAGPQRRDPIVLSDLDVATRLRHERRPRTLAPVPPAFFAALMDSGAARLFGVEHGPGLVAPAGLALFDLLVTGRDDWLALTTGARGDVDDQDVRAAAMFLQELDAVAGAGAARLVLGPGSLPTKLRMGARLDTPYLYVTQLSRSRSAGVR